MREAAQVDRGSQGTRSLNLEIFRRGGVELTGEQPVSLTPAAQSIVDKADPRASTATKRPAPDRINN